MKRSDTGKERPGRRAHLKQFEKQEDGSYRYTGEYVYASADESVWKKKTGTVLAVYLILLAGLIVTGCLPGTGMDGHFFLLLPYAMQLILTAFQISALAAVLREGHRLKKYFFEKKRDSMKMRAVFALICAGIALAGLVFLCIRRSYTGYGAGAFCQAASQAAALALSLYLIRSPVLQ